MAKDQLEACVERIDTLLAKVESLPDTALRGEVQEIVQCLLEYHGKAVARLLSLIPAEEAAVEHVLEHLVEDELVASLLLLHGLHPADLADRVARALERVRPLLASHGGNVELVEIADQAVRLRLLGSCHGCPSSTATMRSHIEQAVYEAAPEIERVELVNDVSPRVASGFVPLAQLVAG
jgi:Fe-S cluster biogenesis protein NfuA